MKRVDKLFLLALKAALQGESVRWEEEILPEEWKQLFYIAEIHHVLPMIYEAVYNSPSLARANPNFLTGYRRKTLQQIMMQTVKTTEFQTLYYNLINYGVRPCVVKGIICRDLYPNPDARLSGDEDVFIIESQCDDIHKLLLENGMGIFEPDIDIHEAYEVPYRKEGSPLYIEVHKHMFPPESEAYGDLNRFFEGIHDRNDFLHDGECGLIEEEINGTKFLTMNHTDHLLYLIFHSFKHFLHSGFGIRQVCDINLFAMKYGTDIDWNYVLSCLQEVRADLFAVSLFKIGEKYLTFDPDKACYPKKWRDISVDEMDMLNELLKAGVFGQSDMSRKHSSNITLNAVIADKRGGIVKNGRISAVISSIFLPLDKMSGRFTYLKKFPFLLPVAWIQRVWIYDREIKGNQSKNKANESITIGKERVALLKEYGIIK